MTQRWRDVATRGKVKSTDGVKAIPPPQPVRLRHFVMVALGIPALFWVKFQRVDGFAIGFTAFLLVLLGGVAYSDVVGRELDAKARAGCLLPRRVDTLDTALAPHQLDRQ